MMREKRETARNKDVEHLAGLLAAGLTLLIMVNAVEGYFDSVFTYFERRLPLELAWLSTIASYGIGAGISVREADLLDLVAPALGALLQLPPARLPRPRSSMSGTSPKVARPPAPSPRRAWAAWSPMAR